MKGNPELTFSIENFQGPLELLLHLVQRSEIDIYEVSLCQIINQFLSILSEEESSLNDSSEFIATAASLMWLKSKTLLPKHEQAVEEELKEEDPHFEIIHHLIDYCRFKQAAKRLVDCEESQKAYYVRGNEGEPWSKRNLGIEHLTLDDLALLFKEIAAKTKDQKGELYEEKWKLSDKIFQIRTMLQSAQLLKINFSDLFLVEMPRSELIVTFLAILELMKLEEIDAVRDLDSCQAFIVTKNTPT